ncbi:MAG: hypothetical protein ACLSGS_06550 [Adlercreutzia sp.]
MREGLLMPRIKENNIMVELRDRVEGDVPESWSSRPDVAAQDFFGQLQRPVRPSTPTWPARTSRPTSSRPT